MELTTQQSDAGDMLSKSRVGKAKEDLTCQKCRAKDAEQRGCLCVLCDHCAGIHLHA